MPMQLYGTPTSGHTHRVAQLLTFLDLPFELVPSPADIRRNDSFRAINPLQQIPALRDGDRMLSDSNAILVYLVKRYAPGSAWLPEDPDGAWDVHRWLSIAAGDIRFGPARARLIGLGFLSASLAETHETAGTILDFMNRHLETRDHLACGHLTIADLACYAYVAHAPEGGLSLEAYPHVLRWLARLEAMPGFTRMPWTDASVARPGARG